MAGFYLDDYPEFETWLVREQEVWLQQVTGILDCLIVYYGLRRQNNQAHSCVKRWLELEPWQEEAHRNMMILLAGPRTSLSNLPPCPYRGLFAFREKDAPFFFGREAFTARLVEAVHRQEVTTVIGPSGSGKTSIVFAGLLPHLHREGGWLTAAFRPGSRPFHDLADGLIPLFGMGQVAGVAK